MKRIAYIAAPYTSHATGYRQRHFEQSNRAAVVTRYAALVKLQERIEVFSPITHGHALWMASGCELGFTARDWADVNGAMIEASTELRVLRLRGWEDSRGLAAEIAVFGRRGIAPVWIDLPLDFYRHGRERVACHPSVVDSEPRPSAA